MERNNFPDNIFVLEGSLGSVIGAAATIADLNDFVHDMDSDHDGCTVTRVPFLYYFLKYPDRGFRR